VLGRPATGEQPVDLIDKRDRPVDAGLPLLMLRLMELPVPPAQLPLDIAVATRQAAGPAGVDVHLMDGDQDVDEILPGHLRVASSKAASVSAAPRRMSPSTKSMT
jgi:hypothetical protein